MATTAHVHELVRVRRIDLVTPAARSPHRFYGPVLDDDLDRLVEIERRWRADLERRKEHWRLYADRLLCPSRAGALPSLMRLGHGLW
jgi:hypothetical protein